MRYSLPIVGARFRPPSVGLLDALPLGFPLVLRREPSNPHDANAVQVVLADADEFAALARARVNAMLEGFGSSYDDVARALPWHLGYIPREEAAHIAPALDAAGVAELPARLAFAQTGQARVQFTVLFWGANDTSHKEKNDE
jgi:hypothetical protein